MTEVYFLNSGSQKSEMKGRFLLRPLSLTTRWPCSLCVLHGLYVPILISSSYKDADHIKLGPTSVTSF